MSNVLFIQRTHNVFPNYLNLYPYSVSRFVVTSDISTFTLGELNCRWFRRTTRVYQIVYFDDYSICIFVGRNTGGSIIFIDRETSQIFKYPFETFSYDLWPGVGMFLQESSCLTLEVSLSPIPDNFKGYVLEAWLETSSRFSLPLDLFFFPS